ncbi:TMEM165/GDT1 family protein [Anabaenopsis elenkinii]|uniref:GDT1 family protein n=1 Tax=Anabaenopsis elenkinii CCIBt3563 TaxID=2779889 RepID=A0A7S6U1Y9_9CYAN|nr:TMEM165/GDT1 family protein [Anabaenopsis elenkinii]QOV22045.1 TMEM165/GDT1 family protein [Anabaenopsis elenkinii CCIBt3563]
MKLDSLPVNSVAPETDNQSEIKDSDSSNLTVVRASPKQQESVVATFATTFLTIFLAEIGDKTQLSTLLISAESHAPWVVFIGAGLALITTSLLGVLLGGWMANRLSPKVVEKSAGMMLLLISIMLFWDVIHN